MNTPRARALPLLLAGAVLLLAQMPDWKYFRDREGNTYFIDQAGKIRIINVRKYRYKPVSPRGIDYYLEYGTELINEHRPIEGLSVLKSICALKNDNNRIYQAQMKATNLIMKLKKSNGPRFMVMNEAASLMLFQDEDAIEIINDQMLYSFKVPGRIEVIRKIDRGGLDYRYSGILFGVLPAGGKDDSTGAGAYDFLVAIDTEKFAVQYKDLSQAVEKWKGNIGYEGLTREVLVQEGNRLIYSFHNNGMPRYAGIEGIFLNGNYSHYVRLVSSESRYPALRQHVRKIMDSFRIVTMIKGY